LKADIAPELPIYRWYLAGGPQALRLSSSGAGVVFGLGLVARLAGLAGTGRGVADGVDVLAAAGGAVFVAVFTARWLGARKGLLAGIGIAVSLWTFRDCGPVERLATESMWVGLAAFALGNVPGRLDPLQRRWVRAFFWAALAASLVLSGAVGPCYVLTICGLYLLAAQDSRGARFLLDWRGLAFFAAVIACLATARHFGLPSLNPAEARTLQRLSLGGLVTTLVEMGRPWIPLAVPGLFLLLWGGHYFMPIWRLLTCWALLPIGLLGVGLFRAEAHLAAVLPPLAVLAAVGLDDGLHRLRRLGWIKRRWGRATA
jgi:hypothetical protein